MNYLGHPDQHYGCITYAQHGEDLLLINLLILLGVQPGDGLAWLDLGAHHPTNISNTKLLYDRGYRGVNVEANPHLFKAFEEGRPLDINVNFGVSLHPGEGTFYIYDDTSGRNTFSTEEVKELEGVMQVKQEVKLPIRTLNQMVDIFCRGQFPPILSSDIEGLDFAVLSAADFTKSRPIAIVVETRRAHTWRMIEMLQSKNFTPLCRTGENLFFVDNMYYSKVF